VSGQIYATSFIPIGIELVPISLGSVWGTKQMRTVWEKRNIVPLLGVEPRFHGHPTRNLVPMPTEPPLPVREYNIQNLTSLVESDFESLITVCRQFWKPGIPVSGPLLVT
jgi:hypothetical protein